MTKKDRERIYHTQMDALVEEAQASNLTDEEISRRMHAIFVASVGIKRPQVSRETTGEV